MISARGEGRRESNFRVISFAKVQGGKCVENNERSMRKRRGKGGWRWQERRMEMEGAEANERLMKRGGSEDGGRRGWEEERLEGGEEKFSL